MKNVGLLISTMNSGGAERVVSHLSHILSNKYNVHVILFEDTYMEYECAGTLHSLQTPAQNGLFSKLRIFIKRISSLKKLIKEQKLDCVISFLDSPNLVNILAKSKGCKKAISIRNYSSIENKRGFIQRITNIAMKACYKRADNIITVSKLIEEDFKTNYGIPPEKITTIYNPYDFNMMDLESSHPLSNEELDFYKDGFVFCNVGRMVYQKGIWHLVKAFSKVAQKSDYARLVIVGENFTDGKLESLIEQLELSGKVLLTGRTRNPYKYMKNSNVYVLSSLFEGFPNAMVEAMSCGLPIIAADCKSGPREILYASPNLEHEASDILLADYGVLIPPLEEDEDWKNTNLTISEGKMADAMLNLLTNKELCQKYSDASLNRSKDFNFKSCEEQFVKIIED